MNDKALIDIISSNGLSILNDSEMLFENLKTKFSIEKTALLMYVFSKKECINELKKWYKNKDEITKLLMELYHFNQEYASSLSEYLLSVFSDNQLDIWDTNYRKGIYAFMNSRFKITNEICCYWSPNGYSYTHVECTLNYELYIGVKEDKKVMDYITSHFKNEFVKKDAIQTMFSNLIHNEIKKDFNYYCNSDDYYEPCCEDYGEEILEKISEEYGLEIEVLEWDGSTSNYM